MSKPHSVVPMIHVADIQRSIDFYTTLGFEVGNSFKPQDATGPTWAWLHRNGANLMITKAGEPVEPEKQAFILYIYFDDVSAAKVMLTEAGIEAGPIEYPFYAPKGEFRLVDPDGYCLMIIHT